MKLTLKALLILIIGLALYIGMLSSAKSAYAGGTCRCQGMSCGNNFENNCTGGDQPVCSGNLGFCGCTCTPQPCAAAGDSCGGGIQCCSNLSCFSPANGVNVCIPSGGTPGIPVTPQDSGPQFNCAGNTGIVTAIGCIPVLSQQGLAEFFIRWGMGLGGGIALIMIVVSSYMIMTAAGDPRKLQAGKELLTAAISGLILIVFGAYILKIIGVDILGVF